MLLIQPGLTVVVSAMTVMNSVCCVHVRYYKVGKHFGAGISSLALRQHRVCYLAVFGFKEQKQPLIGGVWGCSLVMHQVLKWHLQDARAFALIFFDWGV